MVLSLQTIGSTTVSLFFGVQGGTLFKNLGVVKILRHFLAKFFSFYKKNNMPTCFVCVYQMCKWTRTHSLTAGLYEIGIISRL